MTLAAGLPIIFLACATQDDAQRVFARMRKAEGGELLYRNGSLIMYLWQWSDDAPQREPVVAAFAAYPSRRRVAVLAPRPAKN